MSCRTGDVTFSLVLVYIWLVLIPLAHGVGSCNLTSSIQDITVTCISDPKAINYTASFMIDGGFAFTDIFPTSPAPFVNPISFTFNKTVSGQKYRVLVEEVQSDKNKIFIYNATVAVVPLKPINLKVQDRGENFLTLNWETSLNTSRDGHEIYYRKENEMKAQMVPSSADNKYNLTNLSHGTKYVVYIVAVTLDAKSQESDKITESTAPKPPTNVTAVPNNSSSITISWSPPDLFFQGSYLAKYTPRGEQAEVNITGCTKSSCTFTPNNVPFGQPLLISVYSLSQGIYSAAASVNSSTAPGSVSSFRGSSKEAGLVLSWTAPINSEQVSYTINATNLYSLFDSKIYSEPANNITSFTKEIMGLIGGSLYEVKIQAESTFAKGEISTSNIYTLPERVNNLSGVAINTTAYNLTWDLSSRSRIAYLNITVSPESMVQISKSTFYVITDLKPGNLYNVSIVTISDINPAFPSPLVQKDFRTKPVKPKINSVIANETSLTIGITRESSEGEWDYIMTHLNTLSVQVKMDEVKFENLEPGRLYRLEAYTAIGMARSDNITVNLFTKPKPPKSLDVVVDGTRFRAKWESPDFGFDGFNVTLTKLVGTEFLIEQHQGPIKENEIGFPNLTAGATYRVTVVTVKGDQASTAISKENTTEELDVSKAELIGGVVAGIFILIILIIIAVLLVKKIRNQPKKAVKYSAPRPHWKHSVMSQLSRPVKLVDFPTHVQKMSSDSDLKYAEEYEDLKDVGRDQPCTAAEFPPNRPKNRFTNILPYDHSRVKLLPTDDEEGSDYINANYMPGYSSKREYIATQGPLPSTRDDFWRMIWEQNCRNIVMLTRCQEKGREKSDHYWPNDAEPKFYGDLQVTILNETHMPDWTITEFKVAMGEQSRNVRHFHYLVWPDFGVPSTCTSLIRFVRTVREKLIREGGPIVTHCSAGVGRSGTFIVLDHLLQLIREKDEVDIFSLVYKLRKERVLMVQTEQQYKFIHECLLCVLEGREEDITYMNFGQVNAAFEEGQQQSIVDQDTDFGINMDHDDEGINVETV